MARAEPLPNVAPENALQAGTPHVVHVTERLPRGAFRLLLHAIAELDALRCRQTLIVGPASEAPEELAGRLPHSVRLVELPQRRRLGPALARRLLAVLRDCAGEPVPLAVHLHAADAGLLTRLLIATLHGRAACFYTPHGMPQLNPHRPLAKAASRLLEPLAAVLPLCPVGRGMAEARALASAWRRPAVVLDTPVAPLYFDVQRREAQPPVVVGSGRVSAHNAPEAFARLALCCEVDELPVRFVWAGNGDAEGEALLRAGGVHVTGEAGERAIAAWLAKATVYVQTSVWHGTPLSLMQAMAAGVPCVATDVAGHRDLIEHGRNGFVARDADELQRLVRWLLDDTALRQRLGSAAQRALRERCSSERFRHALWHLYGAAARGATQGTAR